MSTWKKVVVESGSNTIAQKSSGLASGTYDKITVDASNNFTLAAGAISAASQIGDNVITGGKLADATITATQIGTNAVGSSELADNAVDTEAVADNAITLAKMAGLEKGKIIYGDNDGNPAALTIGSTGQVLKVNGSGQIEWAATSGLTELSDDASPQLGADLDVNDKSLEGSAFKFRHDTESGGLKAVGLRVVMGGTTASRGVKITSASQNGAPTIEAENNSHTSDTSACRLVLKGKAGGGVKLEDFDFPTDHSSNAGKFLKSDGTWAEATAVADLNDLETVTISGASSGDFLQHNGSGWVNVAALATLKTEFVDINSDNHIVFGDKDLSASSTENESNFRTNFFVSAFNALDNFNEYTFFHNDGVSNTGGSFQYTSDQMDSNNKTPGLYLWNRDHNSNNYTEGDMDENLDLLLRIRPAVMYGGIDQRGDHQKVGIGNYMGGGNDLRADHILFNNYGTSMWGNLTREFTSGYDAIQYTDNTFWQIDDQVGTTMDSGDDTTWNWKGISSHANGEMVDERGGPIKTWKSVGARGSAVATGDGRGAFHTYNVMSSSSNASDGSHRSTGTYGIGLVGYRGIIKGNNIKNYNSTAKDGDWVGMKFGVKGAQGTQPAHVHIPNTSAKTENIAAFKAELSDTAANASKGQFSIKMNSFGNLTTTDTFDTTVAVFRAKESDTSSSLYYQPSVSIGVNGAGHLQVENIWTASGDKAMTMTSGTAMQVHRPGGITATQMLLTNANGLVTTKVDASSDIQTDGYFQSTGSDTAQGIKNADGDIVITWKNDTTVDIPGDSGMTDEVLFSVNGTALTVKNDGDVGIGKDLNVSGNITYGGTVTIVNSTDVDTTSASYTLNSGATNADNASGSYFGVDTNVTNVPQLRWTDAHDYGTGWSLRPHNKTTDYHMAGFLAASGAPGQNQEASGECVFYYDTFSKDLYICTSDVTNN
tara:strand:+ start:309 stop:3128 length:2820 start_codon:yes stop_codon:yes gene_type:complete